MAILLRTLIIGCLMLLADTANAQFGVSFSRSGGNVTGGSLQVGGVITGGGRYVRMGVNANANQLIGIQNFPFYSGGFGNLANGGGGFGNNGFGNFGGGNFGGGANAGAAGGFANASQPKPTVAQFVRTALTFDADKNGELDKEELAKVGAAILAEMRQRKGLRSSPSADGNSDGEADKNPAETKLVEAFVKRSLMFDSNKNKSLSKEETKRMGIVFLKQMT